MKRIIPIFTLALTVGTSAWAGTPQKRGLATIDRPTAEAHVEFLASDELQGREAGWPGGRIAAQYIVSTLKAMGVGPLGQHEGDESRPAADVQNALCSLASTPSPKEDAVGTHFHGTFVVPDGKLFEFEVRI